MSIDKAIEHGKEQLDIFGGEHKEFIETALDTMRKYQQIEEIIKSWNDGTIEEKDSIGAFLEIMRVVEDE